MTKKHPGYVGIQCADCKATANVPGNTVNWQCPGCGFYTIVRHRTKVYENPQYGPDLHKVGEEYLAHI